MGNLDFFDLLTNKILWTSLASWIIAQIIKMIIHAVIHKTLDFKRLVGDGGMPSGHSATVVALTTMMALNYGFKTPYFAISLVLTIIVMHDATSVRLEAGKHAKMLNELKQKENPQSSDMLKEFLGHTPSQVIVGGLLGMAIAFASFAIFGPMPPL